MNLKIVSLLLLKVLEVLKYKNNYFQFPVILVIILIKGIFTLLTGLLKKILDVFASKPSIYPIFSFNN
jgi:hypothetical protein